MSARIQPSLEFDRYFGGEPITPPMPAENYLPPRTRTGDPASSHRAEAGAKRSGQMRGGRVIAMGLVDRYPGRSSKQLAELGKVDRHMLGRRLPELLKMQLVRTTQIGSDDLLWWPR